MPVHHGQVLGKREATADPMAGQLYDKQRPDYKCAVDRNLKGLARDSLVDTVLHTYLHFTTRSCTSDSAPLPAHAHGQWVAFALSAVSLRLAQM